MKKLKNQLVGGLFSLMVLGGSCLPTVFANPRGSEEMSSDPKPPRKPCGEYVKSTDNLLSHYKGTAKYYDDLTKYDSRLVNWAPIRRTGKMPYNASKYIDDIESLTGVCGYVRYILPDYSVRNRFKDIQTEINNLKLSDPEFVRGELLNKTIDSIYKLDGFNLAKSLRNIVNDLINNLNGVKSVKDKHGITISDVILNFSKEKCKSVDDYIKIFTSDDIPEFIPPIICILKSKFHEAVGETDLIKIGRILYRVLFRTMIYRLCMGEI